MIPVDADVAAAITSPDRVLRPTLSIDWDADGHGAAGTLDDLTGNISGWRRTQSWSSDLPDQVRIVEGSAAASLTADVVRGDITGRASTVSYLGVDSTVNGASPATLFGLVTAPSGAVTGGLLIFAVAVRDLTVQVTSTADLTPIGAVTVGSGDTGMRLWLFQHRLRPTVDPYDSISDDVDAAFAFSTGSSTPYAVGCLAFPADVRDVDAWSITAETVSGTAHTTGAVDVPDGTILASVWAWNTGTSGTWTPPAGDTERVDVRGTHASTNIALAMATSAAVTAGTYSRTATSSAATADVAMALIAISPFPARDERHHAANWMSPVNRDSPLHPRRKVRRSVRAGVDVLTATGWQNVRRFTGFSRDVDVDPGQRTAEVSALDGRELMRGELNIPPILGDYGGLNATWLVSWACYSSGLYAAPPPVSSTTRTPLIYMPMHGSLMSFHSGTYAGYGSASGYEVGYATDRTNNLTRATFVTGPFLLGAYAYLASDTDKLTLTATPAKYFISGILSGSGSRKGRVEMYVRGDDFDTNTLQPLVAEVRFFDNTDANLITHVGVANDRRLTIRIGDAPVVSQVWGPTLPADGEWHFCGISWDYDASPKVVAWRIDTTDTTSNPTFVATFTGENRTVHLISNLPVAEVHVSLCGTSEAWLNTAAFTAEAVIDVSLLELAAAAYRGKIEAWRLCADLADAEQAVSAFDEDGIYRYQTRRRLTQGGGQTVQVTVADTTRVTDLEVKASVDQVRNTITVPFTQPRADLANPVPEWLWTMNSGVPIRVGAGESATIPIPFSDVPWVVDTLVAVTAVAPAAPNSYIICNTEEAGTGTDITSGIVTSIGTWTTESTDLVVFNLTAQTIWVIDGAVGGYKFSFDAEGTAVATDADSVRRYKEQPLRVPSSPWIQRADVAEALASLIVADTAEPTPVITQMRIVGDPRLQHGDRIRVVDEHGTALDGEFWAVAITDDWSGPRFVQTLTCRQASTVMVWGSFRWGAAVWA